MGSIIFIKIFYALLLYSPFQLGFSPGVLNIHQPVAVIVAVINAVVVTDAVAGSMR